MSSVQVDIVIPHFNGLGLLQACLSSLTRQQQVSCRIVVVDNGSTDGSVAWLEENGDVDAVFLEENTGFAAAINEGIRRCSASLVLLLNNDTELAPDTLFLLVQAAGSRPGYGFYVPKMLNMQRPDILDGAGDAYLRGGAGYRLGTMEPDCDFYSRPGPVFGGCGGATLFRREIFVRTGLFDEDFFAYLEDVDLNLRMNRLGILGYYVPAARVYHVGSATSGSRINSFTVRFSTRNSLYILAKHYCVFLLFRLLPVICIYQLCWLIFCIKRGQGRAWLQGVGQALVHLPAQRRKHPFLLRSDTLTRSEFTHLIKKAEREVVTSIMHRREGQGKGVSLLRLYRFLFL